MHPINSKYFGVNGIGLVYNNGTSTVSGYIVKQLGSRTFKVTSDGSNFYVVKLTNSLSLAENLTAGFCTILINGFVEHISSLWQNRCTTLEGNDYYWTLNTSVDGSKVIYSMAGYLPGPVNGLMGLTPTLTNASIYWTAPTTGAPATEYQIQYRQTGTTGAWTTTPDSPVSHAPGIGGEAIFGLASGDTYDVQVAAGNAYGYGPFATLHNIGILSLS